ncbi:MAG: CopG family transcriptional regulator [Verrucomicrobia bacterium]|nr:CopG family transcriptional regulator [Verrucomicrobiota bacterium]
MYCNLALIVIRYDVVKTLVVRIDNDLNAELTRLANRRGWTKSAFVREMIRLSLSSQTAAKGSAYEVMLGGVGSIRTGLKDLGSNPKHLEGFGH